MIIKPSLYIHVRVGQANVARPLSVPAVVPADAGGLHRAGHRRPRRAHLLPLLLLHLLLLRRRMHLHRRQVL